MKIIVALLLMLSLTGIAAAGSSGKGFFTTKCALPRRGCDRPNHGWKESEDSRPALARCPEAI